jgi:hypothetical protein
MFTRSKYTNSEGLANCTEQNLSSEHRQSHLPRFTVPNRIEEALIPILSLLSCSYSKHDAPYSNLPTYTLRL